MNRIVTAAAIGTLMLGGSKLTSAHGPDDLFRSQPHREQRMDRHGDHDSYLRWHRESRGFSRHDEHRWEPEHARSERRFEARRDYDRDHHPSLAWHGRERDER